MSDRRRLRAGLVHHTRAAASEIPRWVRQFRLSDWPDARGDLVAARRQWERERVAWCDEHGVDLLLLLPPLHQQQAAQDPKWADKLRRSVRHRNGSGGAA